MHLILIFMFACALQASDVMPPKAQAEIDASNKAIIEVKQNLLKRLTPILADTTKKGDLEGAVTLKKYMDSIKDDITSQAGDLLGIRVQTDGVWRTSHGYTGIVKDGKVLYNNSNGDVTVEGTKVTFTLKTSWRGVITFDMKGNGPYQCTENEGNGRVNSFTIERIKD